MTRHLLVIGAQRCGTTYLYRSLDQHPEISMAKPLRPEPKFFLDPEKYAKGIDWYEATLFPDAPEHSVLGEKSTSYIESPAAAERAAKLIPDADILVMLRDPIERAISNWRFSTASQLEDRSLDEALAENITGARPWDRSKTSVSPYAYLERGRYADYLPPWQGHFPGRVHVLFLEELAGDVDAIGNLYRRIGVDPGFVPEGLDEPVNVAETSAPPIDRSLVARLREYFADSDAKLRDLLGRQLPW